MISQTSDFLLGDDAHAIEYVSPFRFAGRAKGALIVAFFRAVVGLPTFGTFTPILLAMAFREISLPVGLACLGLIVQKAVELGVSSIQPPVFSICSSRLLFLIPLKVRLCSAATFSSSFKS